MTAGVKKGQVAVLLAFVMAAVAVLALMNIDMFLAARARWRLQNAGDAAAIAAANEQGRLLNRIGRLNIEHIAAAMRGDIEKCRKIVDEQRRLALLGPVDAIRRASEAALKNGADCGDSNGFAQLLRDHAATIRTFYAGGSSNAGPDPYPEPYEGAWNEYAAAIEAVAAGELAACADNIDFNWWGGAHPLLDPAFYQAVASKNWCWFLLHSPDGNLLESYSTYRDWRPLPSPGSADPSRCQNCEIFSLGVAAVAFPLAAVLPPETICAAAKRFGAGDFNVRDIEKCSLLHDPSEHWFVFTSRWHKWFEGAYLAGRKADGPFPLAGDIKDEYNTAGADAAVRCSKALSPVASPEKMFTWCAAAKPFGCLENLQGGKQPANSFGNLILPCFTDVRLVPCDSVSGGCPSTADKNWMKHVRRHLARYLADGPKPSPSCSYCSLLNTWERDSFRREGREWLKYHPGECFRGTGSGGGYGGTSRGH